MIVFREKQWSKVIEEFKENPKEASKKAGRAVVKFAKENPEDFAILGAGYGIPLGGAAIAKKAGKGKLAVGLAAAGALPLGEAGIAVRHGVKAWREKKNRKE